VGPFYNPANRISRLAVVITIVPVQAAPRGPDANGKAGRLSATSGACAVAPEIRPEGSDPRVFGTDALAATRWPIRPGVVSTAIPFHLAARLDLPRDISTPVLGVVGYPPASGGRWRVLPAGWYLAPPIASRTLPRPSVGKREASKYPINAGLYRPQLEVLTLRRKHG
jgi:hypothetical protein